MDEDEIRAVLWEFWKGVQDATGPARRAVHNKGFGLTQAEIRGAGDHFQAGIAQAEAQAIERLRAAFNGDQANGC